MRLDLHGVDLVGLLATSRLVGQISDLVDAGVDLVSVIGRRVGGFFCGVFGSGEETAHMTMPTFRSLGQPAFVPLARLACTLAL